VHRDVANEFGGVAVHLERFSVGPRTGTPWLAKGAIH